VADLCEEYLVAELEPVVLLPWFQWFQGHKVEPLESVVPRLWFQADSYRSNCFCSLFLSWNQWNHWNR
jgi:hypothetical protein